MKGNNRNTLKRRNTKVSIYEGAHFDAKNNTWKVQIQADKKKISLGPYLTEEAAGRAYSYIAQVYFNTFTTTRLKLTGRLFL